MVGKCCGGSLQMDKKNRWKNLLTLFLSNLFISAFTFGGGMVIVTFMKKKLVDELHWIDEEEMLDYVAIAQSSPGVIAVNTSILVGWKIGGFPGMIVSVFATIFPPITILILVSFFYEAFVDNTYVALMLKGMQAGVAAVIMDVVIKLSLQVFKVKNPLHFAIMPLVFICSFVWEINVALIIIGAVLVGILAEIVRHGRAKKE